MARYAVELRQTHGVDGQPDEQLFLREFDERVSAETSLQDVYSFLRELEPARTGHPGQYWYRDRTRGHGILTVLGPTTYDLDRLEERVQLHELERAIGMRDPLLWDRRMPGARRVWRNPWIMTVMGGVFALFGLGAAAFSLSAVHRDGPIVLVAVAMCAAIAVLGAVLVVQHVRRIAWWTRARAAVKAAGAPMPSDLQLFE